MVREFDHIARLELGLDKPHIPDWSFEGFNLPYDLVRDSWYAYHRHGILLVAGGYLDQPAGWWADMQTCEALFNTRYEENRPEAESKLRGSNA